MIDVATYILARGYTDAAISRSGGDAPELVITDSSGVISEEGLSILKDKKSSLVLLDGKIYRLARIEDSNYKYICTYTNSSASVPNMIELDVNIETGNFNTKQLTIEGQSVEYLEIRLNEHIENNSVHITDTERNFWNNKVSAEAVLSENEQDYKLKLKKN